MLGLGRGQDHTARPRSCLEERIYKRRAPPSLTPPQTFLKPSTIEPLKHLTYPGCSSEGPLAALAIFVCPPPPHPILHLHLQTDTSVGRGCSMINPTQPKNITIWSHVYRRTNNQWRRFQTPHFLPQRSSLQTGSTLPTTPYADVRPQDSRTAVGRLQAPRALWLTGERHVGGAQQLIKQIHGGAAPRRCRHTLTQQSPSADLLRTRRGRASSAASERPRLRACWPVCARASKLPHHLHTADRITGPRRKIYSCEDVGPPPGLGEDHICSTAGASQLKSERTWRLMCV